MAMNALLKEIRHNPLLWLLAVVSIVFAAAKVRLEANTLLFEERKPFFRTAMPERVRYRLRHCEKTAFECSQITQ
jgi:hypothetical protein